MPLMNPEDWPDGAMHRHGATWAEVRIGQEVYRVDESEVDADTKEKMAQAMTTLLQEKIDAPTNVLLRDLPADDPDRNLTDADTDDRTIVTGQGGNRRRTHRAWACSLAWDEERGKYTLTSRRTRR